MHIIQIWHPCGVANMVVYPEWALSPEGVARGWQCSRGVDYHVSNPAGMSHLFYYTEQHPPLTPGHKLQNSLGRSVILEQHVYRADHVGIYYMYLFYPSWTTYHLNWVEILLKYLSSRAASANTLPDDRLHAQWVVTYFPRSLTSTCGDLESMTSQCGVSWNSRLLFHSYLMAGATPWVAPAVTEPTDTQVASSLDTWLSSNGMRVFSCEV